MCSLNFVAYVTSKQLQGSFNINVDNIWQFFKGQSILLTFPYHLPTPSCQRSFWMTPNCHIYGQRTSNKTSNLKENQTILGQVKLNYVPEKFQYCRSIMDIFFRNSAQCTWRDFNYHIFRVFQSLGGLGPFIICN